MRIRSAKYNLPKDKVEAIKKWCRETEDIEGIVRLAREVNPSISVPLAESLIFGLSYEGLYADKEICYQKGDFYAYRRKLIYKIGTQILPKDLI